MVLGDRDKRLLNVLQSDFPLAPRPFQALGESLDLTETEVIARIADLKQQKVIRQISAIFDTRSLGYKSSLVAMHVQPEKL
ncbi:MAG TPA: Lrp/AsnC family transcriptional regulator, partial [Candidatus Acidoferrum sp.]|nr:Lrp/AsnC family transcriptional regulator [Candidatus Acidoferrum sp.]